MSDKVVGILGGGQLGRMLGAAASLLNIKVLILDSGETGPAKQIISSECHIDGAFNDVVKIQLLATKVDVLTVEIEHVNADALDAAQASARESGRALEIHPAPSTIRLIQDKLLQKRHLAARGLPVSPFAAVDINANGGTLVEAITAAAQSLGLPLMLKSRTQAYDGRGNFPIRSRTDVAAAMQALQGLPLYAEQWVPFKMEIAVMVVRSATGETRSYPTVETVQKNNICHLVFAPLRSEDVGLQARARAIAEKAVATLEGAGVYGVEMFLMSDGKIYINEIAPRPHNSGHYTIEACQTSQYSNHLRAILSLPLGSTDLIVPSAAMLNIIGTSSSMQPITTLVHAALDIPGATVHLYGKQECRKGRKMGHITVVGDSDAIVRSRIRTLLKVFAAEVSSPNSIAPEDVEKELQLYAPLPPSPGHSSPHPLISIIMGSDSDLPTMLPAARILSSFATSASSSSQERIPFEVTIVSAHRTPDRLISFARSAASRGVRVIIAGAGGAAHLPGMVAAVTPLPVIGVPIQSASVSGLGGVDALYSIVQMPRGIPVATVAINNSTNAALLAIRIIAVSGCAPHLLDAMSAYLKTLEGEVMNKVDVLASGGWEDYGKKK